MTAVTASAGWRGMATALAFLSGRSERLRGRLLLFVPICLGIGIGLYFQLTWEPSMLAFVSLGLGAVALALLAWRYWRTRHAGFAHIGVALAVCFAGVIVAGLRTEMVRAPVLDFRYYGPVEGRVVKVDRSRSEAVRLTLDRVRLNRVAPGEIPARVRVSLHGTQGYLAPEPGQRVAMTAFLGGPQGPVEPGGFDFQRMAWFDRIGAVGYTRAPALLMVPAGVARGELMVQRLRARIAGAVQTDLPGDAGAFAAAVTTGDRTGMSQADLDALRGANLAHLLAISGLHMGLLTGFVFAALRYAMALIPGFAARFPARKFAAVGALQAGAFYLALSGGSVATERAFIMVAVMFGAVLIDRRALTLRAVAVAATLILLSQPEALAEPGFQMSFAATTALVAVFGLLRNWRGPRLPRWARGPFAVVISSLVAGLATAPFAAAHFNQVSHFGLLANVLAVPVMGTLVMPLAVLAALLAPVGLSSVALWGMQWPILWVLAVARWVSGLDGAIGHVASPPALVLPLVAAGGLWVVLLSGRIRLAGAAPLLLAFALWADAARPDVLVSDSGGLVGVLTEDGRVLSKPRGEGFAAGSWLENDGDPVDQDVAYARRGFTGQRGALTAKTNGLTLVHLSGRGALDRVAEACAAADLVVLARAAEVIPQGCWLYDEAALQKSGALALYIETGATRVVTVAQTRGTRPWVTP